MESTTAEESIAAVTKGYSSLSGINPAVESSSGDGNRALMATIVATELPRYVFVGCSVLRLTKLMETATTRDTVSKDTVSSKGSVTGNRQVEQQQAIIRAEIGDRQPTRWWMERR